MLEMILQIIVCTVEGAGCSTVDVPDSLSEDRARHVDLSAFCPNDWDSQLTSAHPLYRRITAKYMNRQRGLSQFLHRNSAKDCDWSIPTLRLLVAS